MLKRKLLTAGLILAASTTASALPYGFSDARSVGMGNVSVATGGVTTAAFSNPAMLMVNESNDTFALHIGVGAAVLENGDLTDDIDEFQNLEDQLNLLDVTDTSTANVDEFVSVLNGQIQTLNNLDGDNALLRASPNFALIYGGDSFSMALTAEVNLYAGALIDQISLPGTIDASTVLTDISDGTLTFDPDAHLTAVGAVATEIGVSFATETSLLGMDISVGVRPKVISAEAINYDVTVATADTADLADDTTDLGSFSTIDAGIVVNFSDSLRAGLVAKNILSETLTEGPVSVDFDTQIRAGIAYNNSFFTFAVDMDITESDPILAEDPSKMLAAGLELNAWEIMQFRFGYQTNLASGATSDDLLSAGVGIWLGFNLDLAVVANEDSLGAFVQTGFRF